MCLAVWEDKGAVKEGRDPLGSKPESAQSAVWQESQHLTEQALVSSWPQQRLSLSEQ